VIDGPLDRFGIPSGPPTYPRTYRISNGWRAVGFGCGALFLIFALGAFIGAILDPGPTATATAIIAAIGVAFGLAGTAAIADTKMYRIVLTDDAIERIGLFRRRKLMRDEIQGRRVRREQYGPPTLVLVPAAGKSLKLYGSLKRDATFNGWIDPIPDLDAEEERKTFEEVRADERLGGTPEERLATIVRTGKIARIFNFGGYAVCLWAMFYPRPYLLAVGLIALLPIVSVALTAARPAAYGSRRNEIVAPLIFPGMVLALRALFDVHLIDIWASLWATWALGVALAAALCAIYRVPLRRAWYGGIYLLATVTYAYGTIALGDVLLERSLPQVVATEVLDKSISTGKHTEWRLELAPWGPVKDAERVAVSRDLYQAVVYGERVCVSLFPGAFRLRWFIVTRCTESTPAPRAPGPSVPGAVALGEQAYNRGQYELAERMLNGAARDGNDEAQLILGLMFWEGHGVAQDYAEAMRLFRLSAEQGNGRAMNVIGYSYDHAIGVQRNVEEAVRWYHMAIARGETRAMNNLGLLYDHGDGVPRDPAEARRLWLEGAKLGRATAMTDLGTMYADGDGVPRDMAEALRWWKSAAERGEPVGRFNLAREYHAGTSLPRDDRKAVELLNLSADDGYAFAAHMLGDLYRDGDGVEKNGRIAMAWYEKAFKLGDYEAAIAAARGAELADDYALAARYFKAAADHGNGRAQALLGQLYHQGLGVPRDPTEAARLYRSAAENGDPFGAYFLGEAYDMGLDGLSVDDGEAAAFYLQAAAQGLAAAEARIALLNAQGRLPVRDDAAAARWFRLSAEQEWPEGMVGWGHVLDVGIGTDRNAAQAVDWFERAASYGQADAMMNLAVHYSSGDAVARDPYEAYYWTLLADRYYRAREVSTHDGAQRNLVAKIKRDLESTLPTEARANAAERARHFVPKPLPSLAGAEPTSQSTTRP
jgi:TPR repeat protein